MKVEYLVYLVFIFLALFVGYKLIKGERDPEPDYGSKPTFYNPFK